MELSNNTIRVKYEFDVSDLNAAKSDFDKLSASEKQNIAQLKALQAQFDKTGDEARKAGTEIRDSSGKASQGISGMASIAGRAIPILAGVFSTAAIISFGKEVIAVTAKFEALRKSIDFTAGSSEQGAQAFIYLSNLSRQLGLDLASTANAYKLFSASSIQAGLSASRTQDIFTAVAKATAVMGLSAEDTEGVMLALSQMMSKGNVSAEELRGQLGERLPGAFGLFAKAIGVSEQKLGEMLQKGEVLAAETLPKFAKELERVYGPEVAKGIDTIVANQNRLSSAWDRFLETIGTRLQPAYNAALKATAEFLESDRKLWMSNEEKAKETEQNVIANARERAKAQFAEKKAAEEALGIKREDWIIAQELLQTKTKEVMAAYDLNRAMKGTDQNAARIVQLEKERIKALEEIRDNSIKDLEAKNKTVQKTEKELKAEYDVRLRVLELLREQRQLEAEFFNDPLGRLAADREFFKAQAKLQREFKSQGLKFEELEIKNTQQKAINAQKELEQEGLKLRMDTNKLKGVSDKELEDNRKKYMEDAAKKTDDLRKESERSYKESIDRETEKFLEAERLKQAVMNKSLELGSTVINGLFEIQQRRLDNEMTLMQRRYDDEIRLAGDNIQKVNELEEKRRAEEREIRLKQFRAEQAQAVANVLFTAAPEIVKYAVSAPPLAALIAAIAAAQTTLILAQPVPEYAEGTKGKKHKGGKAMVGERGVEKVVTESGQVYFTPPTATLLDLPKGAEVIPNHELTRQEVFWATANAGRRAVKQGQDMPVAAIVEAIGKLPVSQVTMDKKGFETFIRKPNYTGKVLNNRYSNQKL